MINFVNSTLQNEGNLKIIVKIFAYVKNYIYLCTRCKENKI